MMATRSICHAHVITRDVSLMNQPPSLFSHAGDILGGSKELKKDVVRMRISHLLFIASYSNLRGFDLRGSGLARF